MTGNGPTYPFAGIPSFLRSKICTDIESLDADIAIMGDGFFQIQKSDGTIAYTRDGAFKMDGEGNLVTVDGHFVEPALTFPQDATGMVIRENGQVEVTLPLGAANQVIGQLTLAKVLNPAGMTSIGKNLFEVTEATGEVVVGNPGDEGFGTKHERL